MLIIGALCLNGIAVGLLLRDPSYLEEETAVQQAEYQQGEEAPLMGGKKTKSTYSLVSDKFGLHLLGNWMFVMYLVSTAASILSQDSQHWFIPDRAIEIGFSAYSAAMSLTVANFANIFSRLVFGVTSSGSFHGHVIMLTIYDFTSGLNSMLVSIWSTYWGYMFFAVLFGLFRGLYVIYELLLMVDIVGKDKVDLGYGLIFTAAGLVFLVTIPIFGHFNEVTHSYVTTFILYGMLEVVGGLFLISIPVYFLIQKFKK